MIKCQICQKEIKNRQGLSIHIKKHNMTYKEYYDKFLRMDNEGICPVCGKETKWNTNKYYEHCSTKCSSLDKNVKLKSEETNLKKYGYTHPLKNKNILNKQIKTNNKRYGSDRPLQNEQIRSTQNKTMLDKYGVDNIFKTDSLINKNRNYFYKKIYKKLKENKLTIPAFSIDEYKGSGGSEIYSWICLKCQNTFNSRYYEGKTPLCKKCYPSKRSKGQSELYEFLYNELKLPLLQNYKKAIYPQELDVYIKDYNIAIEFNGNYWHSELQGKNKNYHLAKRKICEQNNIHLINIFEDEWIHKKSIVKARLKHILGKTKYKIHARKCKIKEIDSKTKNKFLNKYHIQGEDKSKVKLGAFYKNRLIAIMTFSSKRNALGNKSDKDHYELSRFASINNFSCVGIGNKLLKYFENNYNPKKIITYADRRWSSINTFYIKLGFKEINTSPPSYWYMDTKNYLNRIHRYAFRKNVLSKKLHNFNPNLSEWENMKNNGYDRIWDCGNYVFEKLFP